MILWHTDILSLHFQWGQLSWDFENDAVEGLFTEVWAELREPQEMMRNVGASSGGRGLLPPLDLEGQGKQIGTHWELDLWEAAWQTAAVEGHVSEMWRWSRETWHKRDCVFSFFLPGIFLWYLKLARPSGKSPGQGNLGDVVCRGQLL